MKSFSITNSNGVKLIITNYGATIVALKIPDKSSKLINIVVGLKDSESYSTSSYHSHNLYLGATVGRHAGRISGKALSIDGKIYSLYHKDGVHIHGGKNGLDKKIWTVDDIKNNDNPYIKLSCTSNHLEENYPGNLKVSVLYKLTEDNVLKIRYEATTDRTTILNLTNHSYFNLNGSGSILNHDLKIHSNSHLEVDDKLIPTGRIVSSKNTRFDFNKMLKIGAENFVGLDDTFVLNASKTAVLKSSQTGIQMTIQTQQPAMVVYTPPSLPDLNYIDDVKYDKFSAICFETQNFPDAPNNLNFPSSLLRPGELYINESKFKFDITN